MATGTRKLTRLSDEGQIAGVCAGLADYFDIDVSWLRVAFVLLALVTGGGFVLVYIVLAVVLPSANRTEMTTRSDLSHNVQELAAEMKDSHRTDRMRNYFGFGLIVVGAWFLIREVFPDIIDLSWDFVWPTVLIIIGIYIATRRNT